jgi:hypothetical protein
MRELIATEYGPSWQVGLPRRRKGPIDATCQKTVVPVAVWSLRWRIKSTLA